MSVTSATQLTIMSTITRNPLNESQLLDEQIVATKCRYQLTRRSVLSVWLWVTHLCCRWSIVWQEHVPPFQFTWPAFCERHTENIMAFPDLVTFMVTITSNSMISHLCSEYRTGLVADDKQSSSKVLGFKLTRETNSLFRANLFGLSGPVPPQ
jgi:hypothetical protein